MADKKMDKQRIIININGLGLAICGYFIYRAVCEYNNYRKANNC